MTKTRTVMEQIKKCTLCPALARHRTQPVIGAGPLPCGIVFLGDAPGQREEETGIPFSGTAGMLVAAAARQVGLQCNDYHLLNVLKCRPLPTTRPTAEQVSNCMPFLRAQLTVIRPKVIVALGKLAHAFVLNISLSKVRIVRNMGKVLETPEYYAVMSCHPRFTVTTGPQNVLKEHLTLARDIAKGEKPICTARNAF